MLLKHAVVMLTLLQLQTAAMASATSEDFNVCKKQALKHLEACFNTHPANYTSVYQCWPENEQYYRNCISRVVQQYSPSKEQLIKMREKQAAEAKLKAALEAKQQKEANN